MSVYKPSKIGETIACRKFTVAVASTENAEVSVLLGKPEKLPDGSDFYCPFQVIGMGSDKIRCAYGIDAFQAIQLAMTAIGAYLASIDGSEGKTLHWDGDDGGQLGFPLPD